LTNIGIRALPISAEAYTANYTAGRPQAVAAAQLRRARLNKLKNIRRVATRYDKTVESFPGFIDFVLSRLQGRHLPT